MIGIEGQEVFSHAKQDSPPCAEVSTVHCNYIGDCFIQKRLTACPLERRPLSTTPHHRNTGPSSVRPATRDTPPSCADGSRHRGRCPGKYCSLLARTRILQMSNTPRIPRGHRLPLRASHPPLLRFAQGADPVVHFDPRRGEAEIYPLDCGGVSIARNR